MNADLAAQTHGMRYGPFHIDWKLWLAGAGIATLSSFGLYYAFDDWVHWQIESGLIVLGSTVGLAVAYGFGYFWCVPDVLDGVAHNRSRTLLCRWSDYALLTSFIGLVIINISYIRVILANFWFISLGIAVSILIVCTCLLVTCVAGSERYLGWTMQRGETIHATGWRARVRGVMRRCGGRLISLVGTKRALVIGSGLELLSIFLVAQANLFRPAYKGYQVLAGTRMSYDPIPTGVEGILAEVRRGIYALGVVVAGVACASTLVKPLSRVMRGSRILALLAGTIALFEVMDLATTGIGEHPGYVELGLWILTWVAPIAMWLGFARRGEDHRNHARLAIMVYYLPVFLLGVAFLPYITYFALGFGMFMVGMFMVWWGLVQDQWETAQKEEQHGE